MKDINNCTFTGRLVRDCTRKVIPSGTALVSFDMANNTGWGDKEKVTYITVNLWGKMGEKVAQYLLKGKAVGVAGELTVDKWISPADGVERTKLVLSCNNLTLLSTGSRPAESTPEDYAEAEVVGEQPEYVF